MKIQTLFDLLGSAQDLLSNFEDVTTPQQMVSKLERLKRQDPEGLLDDVLILRASLDAALTAHIELGGALTDDDSEPDSDVDKILAEFSKDPGEANPGGANPNGVKSDETPDNQPTVASTPEKENSTP